MATRFEILGPITQVELVAAGASIRKVTALQRQYGRGRWRKLKGITRVRMTNGQIRIVEIYTGMKRTELDAET